LKLIKSFDNINKNEFNKVKKLKKSSKSPSVNKQSIKESIPYKRDFNSNSNINDNDNNTVLPSCTNTNLTLNTNKFKFGENDNIESIKNYMENKNLSNVSNCTKETEHLTNHISNEISKFLQKLVMIMIHISNNEESETELKYILRK